MTARSAPQTERRDPMNELREFVKQRSVLREGPYKLASGGASSTFFDMKQSLLHPYGLNLVGELIYDLIRDDNIGAVGGLVIGACPIADVVSLKSLASSKPISAFYVRKDRKATGTQSLIEGPKVASGNRVVVLDDVTTQGGSVLKAIEAVEREWHCEVVRVIAVVDREAGAMKTLGEAGYEFTPLFRMSEFM